jgi:2-polyprenyl-3-methyl-5-hydroxy-6-metoxy-1,4-benzoquinol methylase
MGRIRNAVLWRVAKAKRKIALDLKQVYFTFFKSKIECNICGWLDFKFDSDQWHPFTICPKCRSQVRQRLFWAAISNLEKLSLDRLVRNKNVLHFAPDGCIAKKIASVTKSYTTADLLMEGYQYAKIDLNIDMSRMEEIKDAQYDCVIAFDVLEHIPAHQQAIRETNRVLKRGGYCIFTVPQKDDLEKTYEDISITDPQKREQLFGQSDHFRIYGNDFKTMMEQAGFRVDVIDAKSLNPELVSRNVLYPPILSTHPLATNNRKVYFGEKI